ncbi:MAG: hypothetical protein QOF55_575, partial [Thermoleophilaceae bacterium]|nr:hypothetical protein [Thermoleophilaceae bacterium]
RHIVGAAIFGVGWAVADSCPAPIAAQLTQGVLWSLFTIAGIFVGVELFLRRRERAAVEQLGAAEAGPRAALPVGR